MKLRWRTRRTRDQELDEEIQAHFKLAIEDRMARGESREQAEAAARREFGNIGMVEETTREIWGWGWLERVLQDLRFGLRTLRKSPGFTTVAVLTLALGVGANTAIFSVVYGVLLQPLAFREPNQLYGIWTVERGQNQRTGSSAPEFYDFAAQSHSFDQVGATLGYFTETLDLEGEPRIVHCTAISPELFPMLGVKPLLGRLYTPEEYHSAYDGDRALLSYNFWQRLGADPGIVGQRLAGSTMLVVGVMPPLPDFYPQTDIWATLIPDFDFMKWRGNRFLSVYGRLKHGVSPAQAEQELTAILHRAPETPAGMEVKLSGLQGDLLGKQIGPMLTVLMAAVSLVLLIACVNVATLLLARSETRKPEIAVRITLGAARRRLLQQLCMENLALAIAGGALGVLFSVALTRLLLKIGSEQIPRAQNIGINLPVLAFTLTVTFATSLLFGLTPSLALIRSQLRSGLAEGARAIRSLTSVRRSFLIISEVGLSLVLIIGAGLLMRSLWKLMHADLGFDPEHLLTTYMRLPNEDPTVAGFYQKMLAELPQLPRVRSVAIADCGAGYGARAGLDFKDRAVDPNHAPIASGCWVSSDYFHTMGIALRSGRSFTDHDNLEAPQVAIINESLARMYWPNQNPIGKVLGVSYFGPGRRALGQGTPRQVVGVVGDVKRIGEQAEPAVYMPYVQDETRHDLWAMNLYVRTNGESGSITDNIRSRLRSLRSDLPVTLNTMQERLSRVVAPRRFTLLLLGSFAFFALLLAAVGIHGVVAYSVSRRTREIGLRMALGAARESVITMILNDVLKPVIAGLILGVVVSLACSRLMASMLYGTRMGDPVVLLCCAVTMITVGFLAAWLPARRAASIDPIQALRTE